MSEESTKYPVRCRTDWSWIDRAAEKWPEGPWDGEPDKVHWKDDATGFDCLAVRHFTSGHWCGYVGVPESHAAFGKHYDSVRVMRDGEPEWPEVHGGLTFASECQETTGPERGICHVPYPGDPERIWWLGFDCAHSGDYSPRDAMYARDRSEDYWRIDGYSSYKGLGYVKAECRNLAQQLTQPVESQ